MLLLSCLQIFALHFLTPVTHNYTIDRWMHIRNTAIGDKTVAKNMDDLFKVAFDEDKVRKVELNSGDNEYFNWNSQLKLFNHKGENIIYLGGYDNDGFIELMSKNGYSIVRPPLIEFESSLFFLTNENENENSFRILDPLSQKMMGIR